MPVATDYLSTVIRRLKYYKDLGDKTMLQLSEADFHYQPNEESNSVALIIQHMAGNMLSRWTNFLTEDGEKEWRNRDAEFEPQALTKTALIAQWEKGWKCLFDSLESLTADDLEKTVTIRQEALTVVDAINRQLAHYPYHVGQLIFLGKLLKNTSWKNLSIPKGQSQQYNQGDGLKDPSKKY